MHPSPGIFGLIMSFGFSNSNEAFENACMEFDDLKLKPTYKILWGIPGWISSVLMLRVSVPVFVFTSS